MLDAKGFSGIRGEKVTEERELEDCLITSTKFWISSNHSFRGSLIKFFECFDKNLSDFTPKTSNIKSSALSSSTSLSSSSQQLSWKIKESLKSDSADVKINKAGSNEINPWNSDNEFGSGTNLLKYFLFLISDEWIFSILLNKILFDNGKSTYWNDT